MNDDALALLSLFYEPSPPRRRGAEIPAFAGMTVLRTSASNDVMTRALRGNDDRLTMNHQTIKIERQILQALCQGVNGAPLAEEVWRQLDDYHWLEFEHQTIFTALSSLRLLPSAMIRDRLSQRLTRMGFPDLALDDLFKPCSGAEIEAAINRLAAGK